jgi:glycosyltransferase involved in cell wall biosynthesis
MNVLIVAENASAKMSGETLLSLYYFNRLRAKNVNVWLVCHQRTREELRQMFSDEIFQTIYFIEDTRLQQIIWKLSKSLPARVKGLITDEWIRWITQKQARSLVKQLIPKLGIQLVFEPSRISPKVPSFMYDLGVPVVIGPLAGGMDFPPAFRYLESRLSRMSIGFGRAMSNLMNRLIPGKLQADALIVANDRTEKALPAGYRGKVYRVRECGVDLSLWQPVQRPELDADRPIRFVCMARFVEQKGIPFLVEAFKQVADRSHAVLELIGNGDLFEAIQARVTELHLQEKVRLRGWMALEDAAALMRECHVYVVPSIGDPGNISMMEAMATGMPVIATNWGGVGEIADATCGILVDPTSQAGFIRGLADAMVRLAESPELRRQMGNASIERVTSNYFDWDSKIDRIIEIFAETLASCRPIDQGADEVNQSVVLKPGVLKQFAKTQ